MMDGTVRAEVPPSRDLPFCDPAALERHTVHGFRLPSGDILALRGISTLEGESRSSVFLNHLPAGQTAWPEPRALGLDQTLPAALSDVIRPVLVRADSQGSAGFAIAWPLDHGGVLMITDKGMAPVSGWSGGLATALAAGEGMLAMALEPDSATGLADIRLADASSKGDMAWQAPRSGGLPCAEWEIVTALGLLAGHLYAAKSNPRGGFELWRAPISGGKTGWELVIPSGGWRYGASPHVTAMAVIGERLYIAAGGADRAQLALGDEHPELLAVNADGGWALVSGQQRFSPKGQIRPETVFGPGTPTFAGLAVGGIEPVEEGGISVWLKPLDAERQNALVLDWTPARGTWQLARKLPVGAMDVVSVVAGRNGPCLVTSTCEGRFATLEGAPPAPLVAMPE